jgi:hypothetical protein
MTYISNVEYNNNDILFKNENINENQLQNK